MIPIAKPYIGPEEKAAVQKVLDSGIIAQGPQVAAFEEAFADYTDVKHAIAVSSGTTALHTALLAHGIGPGDDVITTPFTFIASANSIRMAGANPVFADIGEDYNIDADATQDAITSKTKALLPVHLYGLPCDMQALTDIAEDKGLTLIEDACQAHGAQYDGKKVGGFGTGCFSFYPTKNMTTSEGGIITTDDDAVAEQARLIRSHGMPRRYYHEHFGYNFRMTDIAAAIGLEQLKRLDDWNSRRIRNAGLLTDGIKDIDGIEAPVTPPKRKHVFHQYTIRLTKDGIDRDAVIEGLKQRGVGSMIYYPIPVHKQRIYADETGTYPLTEQYSDEVLSLPVHPAVTDDDTQTILDALAEVTQ